MSDLFTLSIPWWEFVLRGLATYGGLLLLMRMTGKRSFGEMSAFDVIVLVLVGGTLRTAIIGDDKGFLGPFIGVASILAADKILGFLCARFPLLNRVVEGVPAILARDGLRDSEGMRSQNVPEAAFDRALHAAGLEDESTIVVARLEPNGKITLVRQKTPASEKSTDADA
jgi:uncharacterized membrane protein YcaP (DUF421 family)